MSAFLPIADIPGSNQYVRFVYASRRRGGIPVAQHLLASTTPPKD